MAKFKPARGRKRAPARNPNAIGCVALLILLFILVFVVIYYTVRQA